jgi:hypothetical protein
MGNELINLNIRGYFNFTIFRNSLKNNRSNILIEKGSYYGPDKTDQREGQIIIVGFGVGTNRAYNLEE